MISFVSFAHEDARLLGGGSMELRSSGALPLAPVLLSILDSLSFGSFRYIIQSRSCWYCCGPSRTLPISSVHSLLWFRSSLTVHRIFAIFIAYRDSYHDGHCTVLVDTSTLAA
jgi:hypothetical protein